MRFRIRMSLRTSLALTFAALVVILSAALSAVASRASADRFKDQIGRSLSGVAYQMSDKLDNFMWSRSGEVEVLSAMNEFQHPDRPQGAKALLEKLKLSFPSFTWMGYMNAKGVVVAATDGLLEGADISSRPVYQNALQGEFIGDVHDAKLLAKLLPNPTGEPMQFVDISVPVKNGEGALVGILAAHLSWAWAKEVQDTILDSLEAYNDKLETFIVSKQDHTVLLGPEGFTGKPLKLASIDEAQAGSGWKVETWPDGGRYLTGYAYGDGYFDYPGLGWTVLVREPIDSAFSPAGEVRTTILALGGLAALLFGLVGWYLAGRIARPIREIAAAAQRLGRGERTEIPVRRSFADIEVLSSSLRNMVDNLTKTEHALDRMETLALHDALTGLHNRIALDSYLDELLPSYGRDGCSVTFLYLDLDGFKNVNDTYGHQAGDSLLRQVAQRLAQLTPEGGMAARMGGDEFVVAIPSAHADPLSNARTLGRKIIKSINKPIDIDGRTVRVGCSLGAAAYPVHGTDVSDVRRLADEALYLSKRSGKNRVTVHGQLNEQIS